ncbi:MAG: hypothetical protein JW727_01605 [Candidatus Aenigmarchaeota archaeon]|nr:hypothetical protein [Candidatus Aenigmarchaeota archaeon]
MIVTELKPFDTITDELGKDDRICVVSCNTCARKCETGGKEGMEAISFKLQQEGYNIVCQALVGMPCGIKHLGEVMLGGDVAVVLGCDASIHALRKLYPDIKIIPALNTVGLGSWDEDGHVNIVKRFK